MHEKSKLVKIQPWHFNYDTMLILETAIYNNYLHYSTQANQTAWCDSNKAESFGNHEVHDNEYNTMHI